MCLHRHSFITYQSIDDGLVYMGNDISSKVVGIGSIRIRMFDGTVLILADVSHVPDIKKSLISLGFLDRGGYRTVVQGVVMKVYKGILLFPNGWFI